MVKLWDAVVDPGGGRGVPNQPQNNEFSLTRLQELRVPRNQTVELAYYVLLRLPLPLRNEMLVGKIYT